MIPVRSYHPGTLPALQNPNEHATIKSAVIHPTFLMGFHSNLITREKQ
jgi:hypothetical protein